MAFFLGRYFSLFRDNEKSYLTEERKYKTLSSIPIMKKEFYA